MKYFFAGILVPASAVIPVCFALGRRQQLAVRHWILFAYLIITLLGNILARYLAQHGIRNTPLFHLHTIVEMVLFSFFFRTLFREKIIRAVIIVVAIVFSLYAVVNFIFLQSIYSFNTYTRPIEAITLILLCVMYWWKGETAEDDRPWTAIADNWAVSGIFFYFSSALFLFIFSNYLLQHVSKQANVLVWNIHAGIVLLLYLLLAVTFLKSKR
ncbi:MAG: hypothetical protein JNL59_08090 [Chitinophagaceae bacterium]|jgi:hypothetical protein|nr:hypothetical protein [Chitinophagaceae bacterium]